MSMEPIEWTYSVQLRSCSRGLSPDGTAKKRGLAWALTREHQGEDGKRYFQQIVVSPDVFDSDEEAKEDAVKKLSALVAETDTPVQSAVQWILDDLM